MRQTITISYKMAIEGVYKRTTPVPDPWGSYSAERGATVHHNTIRAPDLEFADNHLYNIVNLIYYVKKTGYEKLNLSLDDHKAYDSIKDRFYLISSLPEVIAHIRKKKDGERILTVTYNDNFDSLWDAEIAGMSNDDFEKRFNDIFDDKKINVPIPDEIIKKYKSATPKISQEDLERKLEKPFKALKKLFSQSQNKIRE